MRCEGRLYLRIIGQVGLDRDRELPSCTINPDQTVIPRIITYRRPPDDLLFSLFVGIVLFIVVCQLIRRTINLMRDLDPVLPVGLLPSESCYTQVHISAAIDGTHLCRESFHLGSIWIIQLYIESISLLNVGAPNRYLNGIIAVPARGLRSQIKTFLLQDRHLTAGKFAPILVEPQCILPRLLIAEFRTADCDTHIFAVPALPCRQF